MTAKERYKIFCETEGSRIPLFLQYWWMEAACHGKEWDVALVEKGGRIDAALPYLLRRRAGLRYVLQPQLTPYNGPYYAYPATATSLLKRRSFERAAARQLIGQLQGLRLDYFQQNFSPLVTDWLPFHWAGYRQTTRYTYRLPDIGGDPEALFAAIKPRRQVHIRQLLPEVQGVEEHDAEAFVQLRERYWRQRGRRDEVGSALVRHVCRAALQRGQGKLLSLRDKEERPLAMQFLLYDDTCAYSLMSAKEPAAESLPGVMETLMWLAIRQMASHSTAFDFEGSMDFDIGRFYSDIGAELVPFFSIEYCRNPLFRLALGLKH